MRCSGCLCNFVVQGALAENRAPYDSSACCCCSTVLIQPGRTAQVFLSMLFCQGSFPKGCLGALDSIIRNVSHQPRLRGTTADYAMLRLPIPPSRLLAAPSSRSCAPPTLSLGSHACWSGARTP